MIPLPDLCAYLESLLKISEFTDFPNALNGLQVENQGQIHKIAAAVDACEATIQAAIECKANLLIVHHGLFWSGLTTITGPLYRKLGLAIENDLAIFSVHLPLDAHPDLGNNALLAQALKLPGHQEPFLEVFGRKIGIIVETSLNREILRSRIEETLGSRVILAPGGPVTTFRIGIVTGAAGSEIARVAQDGLDTFITGEGPHWCYMAAEELSVNLFLAGHYATETLGIKALASHLSKRFNLPWEFLDHPTGL